MSSDGSDGLDSGSGSGSDDEATDDVVPVVGIQREDARGPSYSAAVQLVAGACATREVRAPPMNAAAAAAHYAGGGTSAAGVPEAVLDSMACVIRWEGSIHPASHDVAVAADLAA